ncbi:MAG TPA: hypothetical protein VK054_04675 [Beutenbergiaceae bacterium]|nr:hypothetical protein [Beutenbergiaceae bacterium]
MTTNPFATPAPPSEGIKWADYLNRLLVIEPLSDEKGLKTSFGDADAVRANVYVIDGNPEDYTDTLVFPKILANQLRPKIGEKVIGRLTQGQAKPGQSAPWMLADASPDDIQAGVAWLNSRNTNQFANAAPTQQAAAPAGNPPF